MEQALLHKLDRFRRRIRRMTFYYGFSLILSIIFGSMLLFGLLDWWFRFDSPNGRMVFASFDLFLVALSIWWFFLRPLRLGLSDLQLAFAIEAHYPEFGESLISTVQFLEKRIRTTGVSHQLEDRLVLETIRKLERIELDRIVNTKPVRRIVLRTTMAIAVILVFAIWNRGEASLAMKRLFLPYGGYSWPKKTQFVLRSADNKPLFQKGKSSLRKANGEVLTICVRNLRGLLPADSQLQIFYPEEDDLITEQIRKRVSQEDDFGVMRYWGYLQIPVKQDKMQFRIQGGDDQTRWYTIDVVPPPELEKFRLEISPPKYTGIEPVAMSEGVGQLRAVLGTRIRIKARSNKKLKSANLILKNQSPRNVILDSTGKIVNTQFLVREPGLYDWQIVLNDLEGFQNPRNRQFEIRAFEDRPPQIKLLSPSPLRNRDEILATANASIPVRVQASDEFGLKKITLDYKRHHSEEPHHVLSLFKSRPNDLTRKKKTIVYSWELSDASLVEGMLLGFHCEAMDHYRSPFESSSTNQHVTSSKTRLLRIVSLTEKTEELLSRRELLIKKLDVQKKIQAGLVDKISDLIIQLEETENWRSRQDFRLLTAIEKSQRAITAAIINENDGFARQATTIKEEAIQNKLHDATLVHTLNYIERELKSLATLHLNRIERDLLVVRKSVEDYLTASSPSRRNRFSISIPTQIEHLKNAHYHQIQVQTGLELLLAEFRKNRNQKDIGEELENILQEEKEIAQSTKETKRETFSKTDHELTSQQRADLYRLAEKQRRLSPRFGKLESELENSLVLAAGRRQPSQLLRDLTRKFRESRLQNRMQQASREVRSNRLGTAEETISEILDSLQALVHAFDRNHKQDLDALVDEVKRIEREMKSLKLQQSQTTIRLGNIRSRETNKLAALERKEREIVAEIEKISRTVRQWDTRQLADSFDRLQHRLQNIIDALQSRNISQSRHNSKESLLQFSRVIEELSRYRQILEAERKRELLEEIAHEILSIRDRQVDLTERTKQLQLEFANSAGWTRPLSRKLFSIRDEEKALQKAAIGLSRKLKNAPAFEMTMKQSVLTLTSILKRLQDRQTDKETVALQLAVVKMLNDLLKSLDIASTDTESHNPPSKKHSPQTEGNGLISKLSQLKLIHAIQEEILEKTIKIESLRLAQGAISARAKQDLTGLAERQKSLRDSMQQISSGSNNDDPQREALGQIVSQMQEAHNNLTARNTKTVTQDIQQQIVTSLKKIIDTLAHQQKQSSPSNTDQNQPFTGTNRNSKSNKSSKSGDTGTSPGVPGGPNKKNKKDKTSKPSPLNMKILIAERKKRINDEWGHLPEALRRRMLNQTVDEKFLMQYREQIKRYFESLATDADKKR